MCRASLWLTHCSCPTKSAEAQTQTFPSVNSSQKCSCPAIRSRCHFGRIPPTAVPHSLFLHLSPSWDGAVMRWHWGIEISFSKLLLLLFQPLLRGWSLWRAGNHSVRIEETFKFYFFLTNHRKAVLAFSVLLTLTPAGICIPERVHVWCLFGGFPTREIIF